MANSYHGSCLCGSVSFSVTGFSKQAANCHCSMCRKFHGAAFGTLVSVSGLVWIAGEDYLSEYTADNGSTRTFCQRCGSSLGFRPKGVAVKEIELAIAAFDSDIPVKLDAEIYTSNKANWCDLNPKLTTFPEGRER